MKIFNKEMAEKYKETMEKDGWTFKYLFHENDPIFKGYKDGYVCQLSLRNKDVDDFDSSFKRINMWKPDGIAIKAPYIYSWEEIVNNSNICDICGKHSEKIVKIAFANKSCPSCEKEARKKYEFPGWCN